MKRQLVILISALLAMIGCAKAAPPAAAPEPAPVIKIEATPQQAPAAKPAPAQQAAEEPSAPADEALGSLVSLTPPAGWISMPRRRMGPTMAGVFINPGLQSIIMVGVAVTDMSAAARVEAVANKMRDNEGVTVGKTQASKDGKTASITLSKDDREGAITVRRFGEDGRVSVLFICVWPKANAKEAKAAYDSVVKSAKLAE